MNLDAIYDNMRTKYGWNDGDEEPVGSYEARDAIVKVINANLPPNCPVEAYGFNRPGMHNGALILYRAKGSTLEEELPEPEGVYDILYLAQEQEILIVHLELRVEPSFDDNKVIVRKEGSAGCHT